jgi:hypothetical protein
LTLKSVPPPPQEPPWWSSLDVAFERVQLLERKRLGRGEALSRAAVAAMVEEPIGS